MARVHFDLRGEKVGWQRLRRRMNRARTVMSNAPGLELSRASMAVYRMLVRAPVIHAQISAVLAAWGMPADVVHTAADIMTETDLAGIDSHGISMLMLYEEALGLEQLNPRPTPRVVRETPVTAL